MKLSVVGTLCVAGAVSVALAGDDHGTSDGGIQKGKDGAPYVVGKEVGKDIPDISLNWCLNDEGRTTVADHRGEVVLVDLWATTCGPCRGLIPSFTKLQQEMGKKGLHVFGITGENKDVLAKWLATSNTAEVGYNMASGSSGGMLSPGTVPYCFLVGADGKVVWQGHGEPPGKLIEAELKKVVPPTPEQIEARAAKKLERAEKLLADKSVLQANDLLVKITKDYAKTESAKKAQEKLDGIQKDTALAAELTAQTALAKILGGTEFPREKLSKKDCAQKLKQIDALLKGDAANCTGTKAIADYWVSQLKS